MLAVAVLIAREIYVAYSPEGVLAQALVPASRSLGNILIAVFLFAALLSFIGQWVRARRFRNTQSQADIRSLTWRQFESFTAEAYKRQGYTVLETPEGPDNGVDLVLYKDGEKTYLQCKHWKASNVGVDKIRELLGAITAGGAHNGIFVTSGRYTQPAKEFARECGIELVDGDGLVGLIGGIAADEKLSGVAKESEVRCPICNGPMVTRKAKRGPNSGNEFWGCGAFPSCRGIRSAELSRMPSTNNPAGGQA